MTLEVVVRRYGIQNAMMISGGMGSDLRRDEMRWGGMRWDGMGWDEMSCFVL